MTYAAILQIAVRANTGQATAALTKLDATTKRSAAGASRTATAYERIGPAAAKAAKGAALAGAAVGAASVKVAIDFDKSMRNVNSIAQLNEKQFQGLQKSVLKLAGPTAQAPKTLAEGLYDLVSSGFNAKESLGILDKSARAASAGLTTTEVSTAAVAAVLNAYKMPAKNAGKVSDVLFRTVDRGVISFESLASNIGDVLSVAYSTGVSLEEVGGAIATMTKQGEQAPEAHTKLKAAMVSLIRPSEAMGKVFDKLGVKSGVQLVEKTGSLQAALQAMSEAVGGNQEKLADLFPNIRALQGALLLTGDNAKGAAADLRGMEGASGSTARALAEQSKSIAFQWQQLKAKATVLGIELGQKLLPQISKVLKVLSNPKLSGEQKFDRLVDMLSEAIERAIPKIADAAARAAPKAVGAFVNAWLSAGVWGRLIVGGWLFAKLGGVKAFAAVGTKAGTGMAAGMKGRLVAGAPGIAAVVAAVLGPELVRMIDEKANPTSAKYGLPKTGDAIARGLREAIGKGLDNFDPLRILADPGGTVGKGFLEATGIKEFKDASDALRKFGDEAERHLKIAIDSSDVAAMDSLSARARSLAKDFPEARAALLAFANVTDHTRGGTSKLSAGLGQLSNTFDGFGRDNASVAQLVDRNLKLISSTMGLHTKVGAQRVRENMRAALRAIDDNLDRGRITADDAFKAIRRTAIVNSKAVAGTTGRNFRDAKNAIRDAIRDGQLSSQTGLAMIRQLWRDQLALYGYSPGQVTTIMKGKRDRGKNSASWKVSPDYRQQTGGIIPVPGTGSGDKVRALLEPGEVVVNRKAVAAMGGPDKVHRLNQLVPRFQGGGIVGLGRQLQAQGYAVGEHPAFGGVGGHAPNSYHYKGMAIDVNADTFPGGEAPALDKLYARLKNMPGVVELLWRVADHFDHLHVAMSGGGGVLGAMGATIPKLDRLMVGGPDSAVKSLTQGALDSVLAAANDTLSKLPIGMEGAEPGMGAPPAAGALSSGAVMDVWQQAGGPASVAGTMDSIAYRESRRIPTARGGPNTNGTYDHGLWQINDIHRGRFGALFSRWAEPLANAKMAVGLYNAAGLSPWDSSAMQLGGIVEKLAGGGIAGMSKAKGKGKGKGTPPPVPRWGREQPYGTPAGQFGRSLDEAIGLVRKAPTRKNRAKAKKALRKPLNTIAGLGLSPKRLTAIQDLSVDYDKLTDYASYASQLDMTDEAGNTFPGMFRGENEAFYVGEQLKTLQALRNRLLKAEQIVSKEQLRAANLMKVAEKRLAKVKAQIAVAAERKRKAENQLAKVERQLKTLKKKPKANKAAIDAAEKKAKGLKGGIRDIEKNQRVRERVREALGGDNGVVTKLKAKQSKLGGLRGNLLGDGEGWHGLKAVQGLGGPMERLSSLPTTPGGFGGFILDAQVALRDLGAKVNIGSDSGSDSGADSERAGLLEQLLREANQRSAVANAQFATLKDFRMAADGMPFAGMYAKGGQIPAGMWGIAGERGPEPIMGPATVVSNRDAQSMLAGVGAGSGAGGGGSATAAAAPVVEINFADGMGWLEQFVNVKVDGKLRKAAKPGARAGRGWGRV